MILSRYSQLILSALVLCGCSYKVLSPPDFEQTNQAMLDQMVKEVNFSKYIEPSISPGANVVLVPFAIPSVDQALIYSLEDRFTQQLVQANFNVIQKSSLFSHSLLTHKKKNFVVSQNTSQESKSSANNIRPSEFNLKNDLLKAIPKVDNILVYNIHEFGSHIYTEENQLNYVNREHP